MLSSENTNVSYLAHLALENTRGNLGKNRAYMALKYDIKCFSNGVCHLTTTETDHIVSQRVSLIKELLSVRDKTSILPIFTGNETSDMIYYLCTY